MNAYERNNEGSVSVVEFFKNSVYPASYLTWTKERCPFTNMFIIKGKYMVSLESTGRLIELDSRDRIFIEK